MRAVLASLLPLLALGACAPFIQVMRIEDLPPEKKAALSAVRIFAAAELARLSYDAMGEVTGNSCRNLLWDPPATREDAVDQMKYWALERGANGLTDIRCEEPRGTSLATNCWESLSCSAKALRVKGAK